jgi:general stress protein YciG
MNMQSERPPTHLYVGPVESEPQPGPPVSEGQTPAPEAPQRTVGGALTRPRGFARMDPAVVREISSKGGKAAHWAGKAHEFNSEEARAAGRKGGLASHARRRQALEQGPNAPQAPEGGREGKGSG